MAVDLAQEQFLLFEGLQADPKRTDQGGLVGLVCFRITREVTPSMGFVDTSFSAQSDVFPPPTETDYAPTSALFFVEQSLLVFIAIV